MKKKLFWTVALTVSLSTTYIFSAFADDLNIWGQTNNSYTQETKSGEELLLEQLAQQKALDQQRFLTEQQSQNNQNLIQQALAQQALAEQQALAQRALAEQQALAQQHQTDIGTFFKESVLIGDSVALGFSRYAAKNASLPIFQNLQFLTAGSFSAHNAFDAISSKSTHPMYKGKQRFIWDSIKMMGAKHAYTFFGLNDLYTGVDETVAKYVQLLEHIKEVNPDIDYTIVSTTPMYKGSEKKNLNNTNIRALNTRLSQVAAENGWGFIDVASLLTDSEGFLSERYCSDSYVHETNEAYVIWQGAFEKYAEDNMYAEKSNKSESLEENTTDSASGNDAGNTQ